MLHASLLLSVSSNPTKLSSFLQDGDSLVIAELAATSRTTTHNKGKKTSPIWAHTREPLEHEDQELSYCAYCEIDNKPHGTKTTSSISKHISSQHKTVIIEVGLSKN
jgi:hypothetical protein